MLAVGLTSTLLLGPAEAAWFPAASWAEFEAMEKFTEAVELTEQPVRVTVRAEVPDPETEAAHPVIPAGAFTVICAFESETFEAPE